MDEKTKLASEDYAVIMRGVHKWYGKFHVLKNINLNVGIGGKIVICGPSGSGKSTLIRCINRLEEHQQGEIIVDGIELSHDLKNIDIIRREVGMVFQHFNLFPHLTALENCTLAPIWVRKNASCGSKGDGHAIPGESQDPGTGEQVPGPALRRPAAARGDSAKPLHEAPDTAV